MEPMTKERREAYVEVLEILDNMDSKYVKKVPQKLLHFFKVNASKEYKFQLAKNIPLEEQKLKDITISVLAMLNLNYWCESEEHKKTLLKKYYDNEMRYQEKIMEQYSTENLFKRERKTTVSSENINITSVPQKYEEPKWYDKILEFIKKLFNIE